MAEYFFKSTEQDWRVTRSNNVTGMSLTKNSEFKVPRIPSRYATQTICSNAPSNQILESSAFDCIKKSIGDRFDLYKKLNLLPVDEVKQISTECLQKLDKLLADSLTQCILPTSNSAPSVINDNNPVFHISQSSGFRAPAPAPVLPAASMRVVENPKRDMKVVLSDDENESILSYFKKNQSRSRTTKTRTNTIANKRKDENDSPVEPKKRRNTKRAPKVEDDFDVQFERVANRRKNENDPPVETKKKRKDNNDSPMKPEKKKNPKRVSKVRDFNITKNSLRNCNNNQIGYEQTDRELFGDVSSIVGGSLFQCSPSNVLKNMTKISSNRNDALPHLFSPFANPRSMSGVSAISTPLSKTISKKALNNRLKKPDVIAEFKGVKSRPVTKRIAKNDILKLDASKDSELCTSDFSDVDENADESTI